MNTNKLQGRLCDLRRALNLSQGYVAEYLGIPRTAVANIEAGKRSVSAEELRKYSDLFSVSADDLLNGRVHEVDQSMYFARAYSELSSEDKDEIINLLEYKKRRRNHADSAK